MEWTVYMLECADGTYYIGITNDLSRRLYAHNSLQSGAKYTRARRPVKVVYSEQCMNESTARKREYTLKKLTRSQKMSLIAVQ